MPRLRAPLLIRKRGGQRAPPEQQTPRAMGLRSRWLGPRCLPTRVSPRASTKWSRLVPSRAGLTAATTAQVAGPRSTRARWSPAAAGTCAGRLAAPPRLSCCIWHTVRRAALSGADSSRTRSSSAVTPGRRRDPTTVKVPVASGVTHGGGWCAASHRVVHQGRCRRPTAKTMDPPAAADGAADRLLTPRHAAWPAPARKEFPVVRRVYRRPYRWPLPPRPACRKALVVRVPRGRFWINRMLPEGSLNRATSTSPPIVEHHPCAPSRACRRLNLTPLDLTPWPSLQDPRHARWSTRATSTTAACRRRSTPRRCGRWGCGCATSTRPTSRPPATAARSCAPTSCGRPGTSSRAADLRWLLRLTARAHPGQERRPLPRSSASIPTRWRAPTR